VTIARLPDSAVRENRGRVRANPSAFMVAGARNHLQANYRSVDFSFEIQA
jgi:hypothetical protein